MKVQYLSDLHCETHPSPAFLRRWLDPSGVDVLVVAGDLADAAHLDGALDALCDLYRDATVVYVHGNHEFYHSDRTTVLALTRAACRRWSNLRWLDAKSVDVAGLRFHGTPLWFRPLPPEAPRRWLESHLSDFSVIRDYRRWVHRECARGVEYLRRRVRPGDVVVTHHLPHPRCVAPKYADDSLNVFFLCDVSDLIDAGRPALWVHGHTHEATDVRVGETRIVANPFGYAWESHDRFDPAAIVESV